MGLDQLGQNGVDQGREGLAVEQLLLFRQLVTLGIYENEWGKGYHQWFEGCSKRCKTDKSSECFALGNTGEWLTHYQPLGPRFRDDLLLVPLSILQTEQLRSQSEYVTYNMDKEKLTELIFLKKQTGRDRSQTEDLGHIGRSKWRYVVRI